MSEKFGENIDTSSNSTTKKTSTEFLCGEKSSAYVSKIEQQLNDGVITLSQYNESKKNASLLLDSQNSEIYSLENKNQSEKKIIFGVCNEGKKELSTEVNNKLELQKLKELGKYFGLSEIEVLNIQNSLDQYQKESGMDLGSLKISNLLSTYKNYIETNLTDLDIQSKEKIIKSIGLRLNSLNTIISDIMVSVKEESGDNNYAYELKRERWNLNQSITNSFEFIDTQLLPTATLISKVNSGEINLPIERELYTSTSRGRRLKNGEETKQKLLLITAYKEGKELLSSDLNDEGNFESGFLGLFDDSGDILDSQDKGNAFFQKTGVDQTTFLADLGIQQIDSPSILNEADKELEADVMIKYIAFIGTMMIPYAGTSTSIPSDFQDIFTSSDGGISTMQMYGLIPDEFKMNNEWYDTAFGLMGVAGSMFGVQSASKGPKVVKVMNRLSDLGVDSAEVANRVKAYSDTFKKELFGGKDPVESEISNIVSKKQLSPEELEARKVAAEKRTGISREQLEINSRWVEEGNLELPNQILEEYGLEKFNGDIQGIINIHENISKGLWKNQLGDIRNILEEGLIIGLKNDQIRVLMENGIFGKINVHDYLLSRRGETLTNQQILDVLNNGDFKYGGDFSLTMLNDTLKQYGFLKVTDESFGEIMTLHKVNVSTTETKKWFSEQSAQNLYEATNNSEINELLFQFKQKPNSLTPEQTELVLHIGERARSTEGQLIFDSKVQVEELRNKFIVKDEVMEKEVHNKIEGVQVSNTTEPIEKIPEKGIVDINTLNSNDLRRGINSGEIDINALSKEKLESLQRSLHIKIANFPIDEHIKILNTWNIGLFHEQYLDRIFHSTVLNADIKQLEAIKCLITSGGRLESVIAGYKDFDIKEIIGLIDKLITKQK